MTDISIERAALDDGLMALTVTGEVDMSTSPALEDAIRQTFVTDGVTGLLIDLSKVTFLDSTGINALVGGYRLATGRGLRYVVTNPSRVVQQVLDITGVAAVLTARP
jgi:anti-sigma B factor antagonist